MRSIMKTIVVFLFLFFSSVLFSQQWQPCKIGLEKEDINYINANENQIIAYSAPEHLFLSKNDGLSWAAIGEGIINYFEKPNNVTIHSIAYCDNYLLAATDIGLFCSTNNGTNWYIIDKDTFMVKYSFFSVVLSYNEKIFFGTNDILYSSNDCGENWEIATCGYLVNHINNILLANNKIYATTNNGMLHLSTDEGVSWDTIANLSFPISCIATKDNYIFLGEYSSGLHISSDDGESWEYQLIQNNEEIRISSLIFYNNTLIAGTDFGVFTTYDFGKTWTELNNGLTSLYVRSLAINDNYLFAGTSDGVYKIDLTALSVENSGNNLNNEFTLQIDNISKTAQLNFFQNNEHFKEIMIYDVLGNIVFRNSYQTNQIKIDLNTFTNGVYFVQVKGNNSNSFSKFVLY